MGENRHRHTVWMDDAVWDQVESHYQKDNCSTKNEYIEKAIQFYSGYLNSERPAITCPGFWPMCWRASWGPGQTDGTPAVQAGGGGGPHGKSGGRRDGRGSGHTA